MSRSSPPLDYFTLIKEFDSLVSSLTANENSSLADQFSSLSESELSALVAQLDRRSISLGSSEVRLMKRARKADLFGVRLQNSQKKLKEEHERGGIKKPIIPQENNQINEQ